MSSTEHDATTTTEATIAQWLVARVTAYDQVAAADIALDAPLKELGLDSIYVMMLCGDIEDEYGLSVDPTFFADHETLSDVAEALAARVASA